MNTIQNQTQIRRASERGQANHGWLQSQHTFSFADYHDPAFMGFRSLRVINEDRIAPGRGFATHPHRDMEIFSYVLEGQLAHKDSMGNERILVPGDVQLMSAGSGITHSEFNPSAENAGHFYQIWIRPNRSGLTPSYTEWRPSTEQQSDGKILIISADGRNASAKINQDVDVWRLKLNKNEEVTHISQSGRGLWLQVLRGSISVNGGELLLAGDAIYTTESVSWIIRSDENAEALLFDLA
jgi:redox-sensitive bicupin YhaK (pirin superfamily)